MNKEENGPNEHKKEPITIIAIAINGRLFFVFFSSCQSCVFVYIKTLKRINKIQVSLML